MIGWAGHVARTGKMGKNNRRPEWNRPHRRPKCGWEVSDTILEKWWKNVEWIYLTWDRGL